MSISTKQIVVSIMMLLLQLPFAHACGFAYVSECSNMAFIHVNGIQEIFQYDPCSFGAAFEGHAFGQVEELRLQTARQITWESCDNNIMDATLYYRIYEPQSTPPAFTAFALGSFEQQIEGDYREKTRTNAVPLNFLAGLSPNTAYLIEMYYRSNVDENLDLQPDTFLLLNNDGANYKATFTTGQIFDGCSFFQTALFDKTDATCHNVADGKATIITCGGVQPYTYQWSNGETDSVAVALSAGEHSCTVTTADNQTAVVTVQITQPDSLAIAVTRQLPLRCSAPGEAVIAISGGTPPYAIFWSNGESFTDTAHFATTGWYTYTVVDSRQCPSVTELVVIQADTLHPTLSLMGDTIDCTHTTATLLPTTNLANAAYAWSGPCNFASNEQIPILTGSCACGNYTLQVTNPQNGCTASATAAVLCESNILTVNSEATLVDCSGTLQVTATVSGGVAPYTFQWQGTSNHSEHVGWVPMGGFASLTVTDANGCVAEELNIANIYEPLSAIAQVTDASAEDIADGQVVLHLEGGVAPYTVTGGDVMNLLPGNYTVTVTDAEGCTLAVSFTIGVIQSTTQGAEKEAARFSVYPNPAADYVTIQLHTQERVRYVQLRNALGQVVSTMNTPVVAPQQIGVSELPAGWYQVEVALQNGQRAIKKLFIQ